MSYMRNDRISFTTLPDIKPLHDFDNISNKVTMASDISAIFWEAGYLFHCAAAMDSMLDH